MESVVLDSSHNEYDIFMLRETGILDGTKVLRREGTIQQGPVPRVKQARPFSSTHDREPCHVVVAADVATAATTSTVDEDDDDDEDDEDDDDDGDDHDDDDDDANCPSPRLDK
ncbi:hypothetical protein M0804_003679 [Polistes exclamans]|nr:hypothetical protein M0804_003679 [Polistes exclamans]